MDEFVMGMEAAQYLGVSRQRLYQLTQEGIGRKISGHWFFTRKELDDYRATEKNRGGRPKLDNAEIAQTKEPEYVAA